MPMSSGHQLGMFGEEVGRIPVIRVKYLHSVDAFLDPSCLYLFHVFSRFMKPCFIHIMSTITGFPSFRAAQTSPSNRDLGRPTAAHYAAALLRTFSSRVSDVTPKCCAVAVSPHHIEHQLQIRLSCAAKAPVDEQDRPKRLPCCVNEHRCTVQDDRSPAWDNFFGTILSGTANPEIHAALSTVISERWARCQFPRAHQASTISLSCRPPPKGPFQLNTIQTWQQVTNSHRKDLANSTEFRCRPTLCVGITTYSAQIWCVRNATAAPGHAKLRTRNVYTRFSNNPKLR